MRLRLAAAFVLLISPAFAQAWIEYVNKDDLFSINFPGQPKVESFIYVSEYKSNLPAHRYTAEREGAQYRVTVVDMERTDYKPQYQGNEWRGAVAHAATVLRQTGKVTFDAYQEVNVIPGHALHVTLPDGRRSFAQINFHAKKLYILEAIVPERAPPPDQFVASLAITDRDGNPLRYEDNNYAFPDGHNLARRGAAAPAAAQ
jgi:hypothetical protein